MTIWINEQIDPCGILYSCIACSDETQAKECYESFENNLTEAQKAEGWTVTMRSWCKNPYRKRPPKLSPSTIAADRSKRRALASTAILKCNADYPSGACWTILRRSTRIGAPVRRCAARSCGQKQICSLTFRVSGNSTSSCAAMCSIASRQLSQPPV